MKIMPLSAESSTWGSFTKRIERKAQSPTQQLQGVQQWGEGSVPTFRRKLMEGGGKGDQRKERQM